MFQIRHHSRRKVAQAGRALLSGGKSKSIPTVCLLSQYLASTSNAKVAASTTVPQYLHLLPLTVLVTIRPSIATSYVYTNQTQATAPTTATTYSTKYARRPTSRVKQTTMSGSNPRASTTAALGPSSPPDVAAASAARRRVPSNRSTCGGPLRA